MIMTGCYRNGLGHDGKECQHRGVMKIISDTARKERVVAKQGKINTHRLRLIG